PPPSAATQPRHGVFRDESQRRRDLTDKSCAVARTTRCTRGVTSRGPSVLVDLDIHDAPSVNQHVAAIRGAATDDLALVERRVRGVVRLLQALFFVGQDLDLLAADEMTRESDRHWGAPCRSLERRRPTYLIC